MKATINPVICPSHIALNDCSNPSFKALSIFAPSLISSFILSKISIFASIAIPIERIRPAIEARVRIIPKNFTTARTMRR